MVQYIFKLKSCEPDLTQKTDNGNQYGGICLIYAIYKVHLFKMFNKEIIWFKQNLGTKTFLRPYKKFWDKRTYRLPYVYWGKKTNPLTRLWVIVPNNSPLGTKKIVPETNLIHQHVKLFGHDFRSKDITSQLFGRKNKFVVLSNQLN
jgi:hypothetical protein